MLIDVGREKIIASNLPTVTYTLKTASDVDFSTSAV